MGGNFREKLEEALRIKFRGFKFRGAIIIILFRAHNVMRTLNSGGARDGNFRFDEERVARLSPVSVWTRKTRGKMERFSVESCVGGYHVYKARTPLVLAYLHESASENFVGGKFRDAEVSHENNPLYGIS